MKPEDYDRRKDSLAGWPVHIVTYRVADVWHCIIDKVDPGANVARAEADSREAAEGAAIKDATRRLERTRRREIE